MRRLARALPALLSAWLAAAPVLAQVSASESGTLAEAAEALFAEGSALLRSGKLDEACGKLERSQALEPAIGTLGLLAYCHEQSGRLATAIREYGEVAELAHLAGQAAREEVARERVSDLNGRVTRLSVVISEAPADVEVFLGTRRLGASELGASTPVDSGTFVLRIQGSNVEPWSQSLSIPAGGSTLRVVVPRLTRKPVVAAPPPPPPPAAKAARAQPETGSTRRPAVWASFGAGALGIAVGSYFGLSAIAANSDSGSHCSGNDCDQTGVDARDRALSRARISTVAFTVGVLGAATGAVLLLTDRSAAPAQHAVVQVLPGGAAVHWERRF